MNRRKAVEIMARSSAAGGLSQENRIMLEDAIEQDLNVDAQHTVDGAEHLRKIEAQMQALADAIKGIDAAVHALEAECAVIVTPLGLSPLL
jgi:hypothetical protein